MWSTFLLSVLVCLAVLYVPGCLIGRGFGIRGVANVAFAPITSVALYSVMAIVYQKAGIHCDVVTMCLPACIMAAAVFALGHVLGDRFEALSLPGIESLRLKARTLPFDVSIALAYALMGIAVCAGVFLVNLDGPASFFCRWDNQTHMNLVKSFVDSGIWSSLTTNVYAGVPLAQNPYEPGSGFYPAAWHAVAALIACISGVEPTVAINALNTGLVAVVLPLSMFAFMKVAFPEDFLIVASGAVLTMSFTALPWAFFTKGPLYPNLLGVILVPAAAALIILAAEKGFIRNRPVLFGLLLLTSLVSLSLAHPNCVFGLFVLLAPFGAHFLLWDYRQGAPRAMRRSAKIVAILVYTLCCMAIWIICFNLPFLQSIVQYGDKGSKSFLLALATFGTISFPRFHPEPLVMLLCIVGLASCLRARRFWILAPAVYMAITFVVVLTMGGMAQHVLAGFWYCDYQRIAVFLALFLVPVGSAGMAACLRKVASRKEGGSDSENEGGSESIANGASSNMTGEFRRMSAVKTSMVIVAFLAINFFPSFTLPGTTCHVEPSFGYASDMLHGIYTQGKEQIYSAEEREFVDEVVQLIGDDQLVINMPHDGSVFAYCVNDLDAYYRHSRVGGQTDAATAIRLGLKDYRTDETVRKAVEDTGAKYILLLDQGVSYEKGVWLVQYKKPEQWTGLTGISDDTPGFTVVLARDDMRLYRIDDAA